MRCMWDKLTLTHTAFAVCEELKMPCPFLFFFEIEDALSIERACFYACPVRSRGQCRDANVKAKLPVQARARICACSEHTLFLSY